MMFACWKFCWVLGSAAAFGGSPRLGRSVIATAIKAQQQNRHQGENPLQEQPPAHNNKDLPTNRDLVWAETPDGPCSADFLAALQEVDPTISTCSVATIRWDEGGALTALRVSTTTQATPDVTQVYLGYYNGALCESFDGCVLTQSDGSSVPYPGQYSYDCSNVYCGPNAARDCDGTYQDTTCQAGNSSQTLIPLLRNVNCAGYAASLTQSGLQCGSCVEADDSPLTSITCETEQLPGCDGSSSLTSQGFVVLSETLVSFVDCVSETGGPEICTTDRAPPLLGAAGDETLFSCTVTVGGVECSSCSICGFEDGAVEDLYTYGDVIFEADCTNVDNISRFNDCDNTASGVFDLKEYDPDLCQSQPAAPVEQTQPVAAPAIAMPTMTAAQPQSPAEAPILQPTTALQPSAPVPAPATSTIAAPVAVVPNGTPMGTAPAATPVGVPVAAPTEPKIPSIFSSSGKAYVSKGLVVMMAAGLFIAAGSL